MVLPWEACAERSRTCAYQATSKHHTSHNYVRVTTARVNSIHRVRYRCCPPQTKNNNNNNRNLGAKRDNTSQSCCFSSKQVYAYYQATVVYQVRYTCCPPRTKKEQKQIVGPNTRIPINLAASRSPLSPQRNPCQPAAEKRRRQQEKKKAFNQNGTSRVDYRLKLLRCVLYMVQ